MFLRDVIPGQSRPSGSLIDRIRVAKLQLSERFRKIRRQEAVAGQSATSSPVIDNEAWDLEYAKWRPPALSPRKVMLTPSASSSSLVSSFETQLQSPLFRKIPPEIRVQIWREVVGNQMIHILLQSPGLSHVECYCPGVEDWWRHQCIVHAWDGTCPFVGQSKRGGIADGGKLELLRSCKRAYFEAVDLMYSTNTFDINDRDRLVDFTRSILPQRLAMIGGLNFRYFYNTLYNRDPSMKLWRGIVDIFKRMEGLLRLKLEISTEKTAVGPRQAATDVDEKKLFEPLKEIKHIKDFVVEVNWLGDESGVVVDNAWPFELKRLTHR